MKAAPDSRKARAGRQLVFSLVLLAVAIAGYLVTSHFSPQAPAAQPLPAATSTDGQVAAPAQPVPPAASTTDAGVPRSVTLEGTYVCLPHRDTSGPQTLECALGLKADDGMQYALDMRLAQGALADAPTGARVRVRGSLVRAEALSTDRWRKYDIVGIVSVTAAERI